MVGASPSAVLGAGPAGTPLWQSLAWIVGLQLVFVPLAVRRYWRIS